MQTYVIYHVTIGGMKFATKEKTVPLFANGLQISSLVTDNFPKIANGLRNVGHARAHGIDIEMSFGEPQRSGEALLVSTHRQPLHWTVLEDETEHLRNILEADCCYHINLRSEGETPLGAAIRLNRLKFVEIFSGDDRFDFNQICREEGGQQWYPLTLAVHLKKRLLVKQILKVKDLDLSVTTDGLTALEMAAKNRHKEPHIYSLLQAATQAGNSEVSQTAIVPEDINDILKFVEGDVGAGEVKAKSPRKNKPRRRNKNKNRKTSEEKDQEDQEELGKEASSEEETEDKNLSSSDDESFGRLISFLKKCKKEKEEAIREKESELECPVCLETAGGEIFSCVEQHLVCSQCRPRVVECPQCRQSYPPTPIRHRYAEKSVGELQRLREELAKIVGELYELTA